jgi:acyl carrier protein
MESNNEDCKSDNPDHDTFNQDSSQSMDMTMSIIEWIKNIKDTDESNQNNVDIDKNSVMRYLNIDSDVDMMVALCDVFKDTIKHLDIGSDKNEYSDTVFWHSFEQVLSDIDTLRDIHCNMTITKK